MSYEITGKLLKKFDTQQVSATFSKREFVIETDGQYPQQIKFELTNDKTVLIDHLEENTAITVFFNIDGREWNGKYFVNLKAWKIKTATTATETTTTAPATTTAATENTETTANDDDLPF